VWEQRLTGGNLPQVSKSTSGRIFDFAWTRDGKALRLAKRDVTQDVLMI
jgi:hypothetical protein